MASPLSVLKTVLNLNRNCMHVTSCEEVTALVQHYDEMHEQERIIVHARPYSRVQMKCPECGRRCPGYDYKQDTESSWRAPNLNGVPVFIYYRPGRINCPEHGVLTEYIPWADGDSRFTEDFNNEVAWMVCRMSKSSIALFEGINWRTVGNCVKAATGRIEPDVSVRLHGLRRICVDETSYHKGFTYITVVYDMDRNRVVRVHDGNGLEVFRLFCEALNGDEREAIEIVAGDGARWIDTCVKEYFPNAARCIDFFHVVEWANDALDKVRSSTAAKAAREYNRRKEEYAKAEQEAEEAVRSAREEFSSMPRQGRPSRRKKELLAFIADIQESMDAAPPVGQKGRPRKEQFSARHQEELDQLAEKARNIKGARHALGHNPENCTDSQTERIRLIENSYPDLYKAYQLKESLRLILHMSDPELAREELDKWIVDAAGSGITAMAALSEKISRHKENILNSVRNHANSARSEATNTTIKVLIKMAGGFRNLDNMIALIYLKCSDLVIPLHNRCQMTPEQAAASRKAANEARKRRQAARVVTV